MTSMHERTLDRERSSDRTVLNLDPPPLRTARTAPAVGVVVLPSTDDVPNASRVKAEVDGRIAVGTHLLVVDLGKVDMIDSALLVVLADAANRLHDERCGSVILRDAPAPILQQLRLMRLDHLFDLERSDQLPTSAA